MDLFVGWGAFTLTLSAPVRCSGERYGAEINPCGVSTSSSTPASSTSTTTQQSRCACTTDRAPSSPASCPSSGQNSRPKITGCPCCPACRGNTIFDVLAASAKRRKVADSIQGISPSKIATACAWLSPNDLAPAVRLCPIPDAASRLAITRQSAGKAKSSLHSPARNTTRTSSNTARARSTLWASRLRPSAKVARRLSAPKRRLLPAASTSATTLTVPPAQCHCAREGYRPAPPKRSRPGSCCPG